MTESQPPLDDRSSIARGIEKATEVTTVAFIMVLPILLGYWLDLYLNTGPLFAATGLALGMAAGIRQLINIVNRPMSSGSGTRRSESQNRRDVESGRDDVPPGGNDSD